MSLIHEALKRAEADKVRNSSPYFDNLTVLTPAEDDAPPPPLPPVRTRPEKRGFPALGGLGGLLIAVGLLGGMYVWYRSPEEGGPQSAGAARPPAAGPHAAPSSAAQREVAAASRPRATSQDAGVALARTLEATRYYDPPEAHAAGPMATSAPAAEPKAEPTTEPAVAVAAAGPAPDRRKPEPPAPPRLPLVRASVPTAAQQRQFRLSAIMRGPEGNVALINGNLFREGQTVLGARIVSIGRYQVELESAGQRFLIGM